MMATGTATVAGETTTAMQKYRNNVTILAEQRNGKRFFPIGWVLSAKVDPAGHDGEIDQQYNYNVIWENPATW